MTDRRGITMKEAAAICGISPSGYREWMAKGLVPRPWPGTRKIDRKALEAALDKLSGLDHHSDDPFEQWLAEREKRNASTSAAHT